MLVLRFLRTVTYSTTDILAAVLNISKREHVIDFLKGMEQANVITHREFTWRPDYPVGDHRNRTGPRSLPWRRG